MGSLNIAKCPKSSSNHSQSMTAGLFLCLLAFHQASLAPQYADQTNQELFGNQLEVFGDSQVEEVDSAHTVKNEAPTPPQTTTRRPVSESSTASPQQRWTTSSRTTRTTRPARGTSACPTTSATTGPLSPTGRA